MDDLFLCEHHRCKMRPIHCVQRRRRALEARACSITILRQKYPVDDTIRFGFCAKCEQGRQIAREHDGPVADPRDTFRVATGYHASDFTHTHHTTGYTRPRLDLSDHIKAHGCRTEKELFEKLYAEHGDMRKVGAILGCSKPVVSKRMKEFGIPATARYKQGR